MLTTGEGLAFSGLWSNAKVTGWRSNGFPPDPHAVFHQVPQTRGSLAGS
jgi:hypothetical protein